MTQNPNVVPITWDQLRKDALGCYDNPVIKTPNIDCLAASGVCFDQMYVASPVCAPNRASIATGHYPAIALPAPSPIQEKSRVSAFEDENHSVRDAVLIEENSHRRCVRTHEAMQALHI